MSKEPITILHVEDDELDILSLKRSFLKARIENTIVVARDGEEALDTLRGDNGKERIEKPFVMLIDINMPRMNGIELLREIRADDALHNSVVFVLTTSDHHADMIDAYDLNVAGYLLKRDLGAQFLKAVTLLDCFWQVVSLPIE